MTIDVIDFETWILALGLAIIIGWILGYLTMRQITIRRELEHEIAQLKDEIWTLKHPEKIEENHEKSEGAKP